MRLAAITATAAVATSVWAAKAQPAPTQASLAKSYTDCVDLAAVQLDDAKETADTIARAAMFACTAQRKALNAFVRSEVQDSLSGDDPVLGNDQAFDENERAQATVQKLMDRVDQTVRDRVAFVVLKSRSVEHASN